MLVLINAEADVALSKLEISSFKPFVFEELKTIHIATPKFYQGGTIEHDHLSFTHTETGRFIHTIDRKMDADLERRAQIWERMPSLVDTNGAVALATRWLRALDLDVANLAQEHRVQVMQMYHYNSPAGPVIGGSRQDKRMLPRFEVYWGVEPEESAVWVSVFGPDKSPLYIRQQNGAKYSYRPKRLVKEPEKLLSLADDAFMKMIDSERQKLVLTHASTNYPNLRFPPRDWFERRFAPPPATAPPAPSKKPANVVSVPPKKPDKAK
jgi:hypothetical protein